MPDPARYNPLTDADLAFLQAAVAPDGKVYSREAIHEDYSHDEMGALHHYPEALVEVTSTAQVSAILRYANDHLIPVTPRGQGTGLVGASVALCGGIMLSTLRMNRILELDEENLTLTVEPGVYRVGLGGVRIEDLILVRAAGSTTLTHTPKDSLCLQSPQTI